MGKTKKLKPAMITVSTPSASGAPSLVSSRTSRHRVPSPRTPRRSTFAGIARQIRGASHSTYCGEKTLLPSSSRATSIVAAARARSVFQPPRRKCRSAMYTPSSRVSAMTAVAACIASSTPGPVTS